MSTNISELIYEMECCGVPTKRANEIAVALLVAGARSVAASLGELAGEREASSEALQAIAASLVALSNSHSDGEIAVALDAETAVA